MSKIGVPGKIAVIAINLFAWLKADLCIALPPAEDVPEEVLRTEIILEGRSPVDGEPLSAAEYEELKAQLAEAGLDPQVAPDIRQLIFLLQLRKFLKTIIPFY